MLNAECCNNQKKVQFKLSLLIYYNNKLSWFEREILGAQISSTLGTDQPFKELSF